MPLNIKVTREEPVITNWSEDWCLVTVAAAIAVDKDVISYDADIIQYLKGLTNIEEIPVDVFRTELDTIWQCFWDVKTYKKCKYVFKSNWQFKYVAFKEGDKVTTNIF